MTITLKWLTQSATPMANDIVVVRYPSGTGGNWLSCVIAQLEAGTGDIQPSQLNFHDSVAWPKSKSILATHNPVSPAAGYFVYSTQAVFRCYLNCWQKWRSQQRYFQTYSLPMQLFDLSNNVSWRMSEDHYENFVRRIDIDYLNLYQDTDVFIDQLYTMLTTAGLDHTPNDDFVRQAIAVFLDTCVDVDQHLGNYNSLPWLAWCHAICSRRGIALSPVTNATVYTVLAQELQQHHDLLIKETQQYV